MKIKIVLLCLLLISCDLFGQTRPSWYQLKDVPSWVSDNTTAVFDIRAYADEADPFAAVWDDAHGIRGAVILVDNTTYTTAGVTGDPLFITVKAMGGSENNQAPIIQFTGNTGFTTPTGSGLYLQGLHIYGPGTSTVVINATSTHALASVSIGVYASSDDANSAGALQIDDCKFRYWDVATAYRGAAIYKVCNRTTFEYNRIAVLTQVNTTGYPNLPSANIWDKCFIRLNELAGVFICGGTGLVFRDCAIEHNGESSSLRLCTYPYTGIVVWGQTIDQTSSVLFSGGYHENNAGVTFGSYATLVVENMFETRNALWTGVDSNLVYKGSSNTPFELPLFQDYDLWNYWAIATGTATTTVYLDATDGYYRTIVASAGAGVPDNFYTTRYLVNLRGLERNSTAEPRISFTYKYKIASGAAANYDPNASPIIWPGLNFRLYTASGTFEIQPTRYAHNATLPVDTSWIKIQGVFPFNTDDTYADGAYADLWAFFTCKATSENLSVNNRTIWLQDPVVSLFVSRPFKPKEY